MRTTHLVLLALVVSGCAGTAESATTTPPTPSHSPQSEPSTSPEQREQAACWPVPGDASPVVPSLDGAAFVSGCLSGNKPRLPGLTADAEDLFRERWAASTEVPAADVERCTNPLRMGVGYVTVQTDGGEWVALGRSPCGYLTFPSSDADVSYAVRVTFTELDIADELRGARDSYFLSQNTPRP